MVGAGAHIGPHRVPLREGAPPAVLARESDPPPLVGESGEGGQLGRRPVDGSGTRGRRPALLHEPLHLAVRFEALGEGVDGQQQRA